MACWERGHVAMIHLIGSDWTCWETRSFLTSCSQSCQSICIKTALSRSSRCWRSRQRSSKLCSTMASWSEDSDTMWHAWGAKAMPHGLRSLVVLTGLSLDGQRVQQRAILVKAFAINVWLAKRTGNAMCHLRSSDLLFLPGSIPWGCWRLSLRHRPYWKFHLIMAAMIMEKAFGNLTCSTTGTWDWGRTSSVVLSVWSWSF